MVLLYIFARQRPTYNLYANGKISSHFSFLPVKYERWIVRQICLLYNLPSLLPCPTSRVCTLTRHTRKLKTPFGLLRGGNVVCLQGGDQKEGTNNAAPLAANSRWSCGDDSVAATHPIRRLCILTSTDRNAACFRKEALVPSANALCERKSPCGIG